MKYIELTQGMTAMVDDEDFDQLNQLSWYFQGKYAARIDRRNGRRTIFYMHRIITKVSDGQHVDHINGDRLDNRKANLRIATRSQNQWNRGPSKNSTSGHKGVYWHKIRLQWMAAIEANGKRFYLGYFDSKSDAINAHKQAADFHHGEFSRP
jgi:hypothetical protein